jgi:hypothetical protein
MCESDGYIKKTDIWKVGTVVGFVKVSRKLYIVPSTINDPVHSVRDKRVLDLGVWNRWE